MSRHLWGADENRKSFMWRLLSCRIDARTVSNVIPFYIFNRAKRDVTCWLVYTASDTVTGQLKSKKPPAQTRLKSTHKRSRFVHKLSSHREEQQLVSDKQMFCLMTDDWMFVWGQDKPGEIRSCVHRGLNRKTTIWGWMNSSTVAPSSLLLRWHYSPTRTFAFFQVS